MFRKLFIVLLKSFFNTYQQTAYLKGDVPHKNPLGQKKQMEWKEYDGKTCRQEGQMHQNRNSADGNGRLKFSAPGPGWTVPHWQQQILLRLQFVWTALEI